MELHGSSTAKAERAQAIGRLEQMQKQQPMQRRPASASASRPATASADGRGLQKAQSTPESAFCADRGHAGPTAVPRAKQRPLSAPARRQGACGARGRPASAGKPMRPQVDMNKAGPLGCAPRWTMRGRPCDDRLASRTPGPGQYDEVAPEGYWCKKKPSFSIAGARKRSGSAGAVGIGVFVPFKPKSPGCTMGKRFDMEDQRPRAPGPGTYDPPIGRSTMKKSFSAAVSPPDSRSANPGPGAYSHPDQFYDITRPQLPKTSFPKAIRKWDLQTGPEPGAYDHVGFREGRNAPVYTFGTKCAQYEENHANAFVTYSQFA